MFVLDNPGKLDTILDAWEKIGIRGVTIIESTGIQRRRKQRKRIPMRFALEPLMVGGEEGNLTLITIVEGENVVRECMRVTEEIIGDLDQPNTGVMAAWPLSIVKGLPPLQDTEDA
jgi:hypothetical protein